jgi:hypothetical protein
MGKMVTGVQRMELQKRVTKKPDGDVLYRGVPMVDQGQKGYCVAASCQRLFEYMRIPCDQHEMAKLVSVDADSGANVFDMQKSLAKIDSAFKVTFKPLVNPEQYYSANRQAPRVRERVSAPSSKRTSNKGVPLLWAWSSGKARRAAAAGRRADTRRPHAHGHRLQPGQKPGALHRLLGRGP